jgi:hypothetical protein
MSLVGQFAAVKEETFATFGEAQAAVEAHATSGGFTLGRIVDDEDGVRFTATTPGGRAGRNIAFGDWSD